jgi:hypothetical protein
MDEMNYLYEIEQAANSYEIAETLNVIRGANPKAEMIYQEHFNKARTMMKRIAEDYEKEYSDVLKDVRFRVKTRH